MELQRRKEEGKHAHLVMKGLMEKIKAKSQDFRRLVKEKNIDYYNLSQEQRKMYLTMVVTQFRQTQKGQQLLQDIKSELKEQAGLVNSSDNKRIGYLVDCYRQASAFPIAKNRHPPGLNLSYLHARNIKKELRRVIWSRLLNIDKFRMQFSKWDREISPFKLKQELTVCLEKTSSRHKVTLKDNQLDNWVRIVQYFIKSQQRLPQIYIYYLTLLVVNLYSFTKPQKIIQLGSISLGIINILEHYQQAIPLKVAHIKQMLTIIDEDTLLLIQNHYQNLGGEYHYQKDILECFQVFRLTAGCYYLSLQVAQFIIDQLLIRKQNVLDIYCCFAIMILIISDQFEPQFKKGTTFKQILSSALPIVKKEDFIYAYKVVYHDIPPSYTTHDVLNHPNHQLLAAMATIHKQPNQYLQIQHLNDDQFVVDIKRPLRIGHRK